MSAGLIISIVMIINRKRTLTSLIVVLSFLLGFYIIGSLFRVVLIAMATKETDTEEDNNETAAEMWSRKKRIRKIRKIRKIKKSKGISGRRFNGRTWKRKALDVLFKNRTPELREQIIIEYAPLVKLVAGRLSMYLGYNVEYEDLVSYGIFGLIDAIDKFDYGKTLNLRPMQVSESEEKFSTR